MVLNGEYADSPRPIDVVILQSSLCDFPIQAWLPVLWIGQQLVGLRYKIIHTNGH